MIYEILHSGEEEAVSMSDLSARLGVSDRHIRKLVHDERRAGYPILSGVRGYYLPSEDPETARAQLERFQHEQQAHGRAHFATVAAIRRSLPKVAAEQQAEDRVKLYKIARERVENGKQENVLPPADQ